MTDKFRPENESAVEFESLKPGDLVRFNYPGAGDAGLHRVTGAPYKIELSGGEWTWGVRVQPVAVQAVKP